MGGDPVRTKWKGVALGIACAACIIVLMNACGSRTLQREEDRQVWVYDPIQTSYLQMEQETVVITSMEELNAFGSSHGTLPENASYQQSFGTLEETFFEDHFLVCAVLPAGSGAERFEIEQVEVQSDGTVRMEVRREKGETGTAVMSQWYLFAEISRNGLDTVPDHAELLILS